MASTMQAAVGPVTITTDSPFQSQTQGSGTVFVIPRGFRLQNTSGQTLFLSVESTADSAQRRRIPAMRETSTVTLYPGQRYDAPEPPAHQVWQVAVFTRRMIRHTLNDLGDFALVIAGLAAYGGYEVVKQRKTIYHRVRRLF